MQNEELVIRTFNAIAYLQRGCTMQELAGKLSCSLKTAYRYLEIVQKLGYEVNLEDNNRYKAPINNRQPMYDMLFSLEEVDTIKQLLEGEANSRQKTILNKVLIHSENQFVPHKILGGSFVDNINAIKTAIANDKRIMITGYASANSNKKSDFMIEPLKLDDYYRRLYCIRDNELRQLKTERIGSVKILESNRFWSKDVPNIETDDFFWVFEKERINVVLELSLAAYEIIKEEYPRVIEHTKVEGNKYIYDAEVANLKAITSLILRLPEEIIVISPLALEKAVVERIKKFPFFEKYFIPLS